MKVRKKTNNECKCIKYDYFFPHISILVPKPRKAANMKSKPRNKKDEEKELRKEIMELEKTFESLDLDTHHSHHTSVKKSNFSRGGLFRSSTIDESYHQRPTNGSRRPPPMLGFGTPAVSKPLKFSWEETSAPAIVDKHTDDWNYQQVPFCTLG